MRLTRNAILAILLAVVVIGFVIWAFLSSRKDVAAEAQREKPIAAPSRLSVVGGVTLVTLDTATLARSGIVVAPLAPASLARQQQAFATVVDLRDLFDTQKTYVIAKAEGERAAAELVVSQREYERLRALNADHKNVSDKAVEAAYATYRGAQANAESALNAVQIASATAEQQFGAALAQRAISTGGLAAFTTRQQVVLQVSFPSDAASAAPPQITVTAPDGRLVSARLLGTAGRTDPKLQGRTFLYIAPGTSAGLLPGMNVQVYLATGSVSGGVLIPTSAVVWTQGTSWVYLEQQAGKFARRPVPLDSPTPNGWFVTTGFMPGERVVVTGAQLILSEEFRSQVQVGGEDNK